MPDVQNRRPLASRKTGWASAIATALARTRITPNQISMAGMVAALIAGMCFWAAGNVTGLGRGGLLLGAAMFVQVRLLCNLFDGMVAVEAGRGSPDGNFWNEFPDRISDMLILVGAAFFVGEPALGWAATALAFLTAYVRELGVNCGAGADFRGPMAKPHRMALVTLAAVLSVAEPYWHGTGQVLLISLWIVIVGAAITAARRAFGIVAKLKNHTEA